MTNAELSELIQSRAALRKRNPELGDATISHNQIGGLASGPVSKSNSINESVAENAREAVDQVRCLVRITSLRSKVADTDNLFVKHFVDACKEAGLVFDDSPKWCKIEVEQEEVSRPELERTEIEITRLT